MGKPHVKEWVSGIGRIAAMHPLHLQNPADLDFAEPEIDFVVEGSWFEEIVIEGFVVVVVLVAAMSEDGTLENFDEIEEKMEGTGY